MEFDFCLVSSWSEQTHRQMLAWGSELSERGYKIMIISPTSPPIHDTNFEEFILSEHVETAEDPPTYREIEDTYNIPSLDYLTFTERQFFGLSRSDGLRRAIKLTEAVNKLFSEHSFDYTLQIRGPEIHRLLLHYVTKHEGGTPVWAGFSPFEGTFSLTTALDGSWDSYQTIPYESISAEERTAIINHIKRFRRQKKFYEKESTEVEHSVITRARHLFDKVVHRKRPGRLSDQIKEEVRLRVNHSVNERILPSIRESRRLCNENNYVFFPLQYPIESRLTVFSPQFFRQEYLVEYLSRILPADTKLFVKPHPHHPGRPAARQVNHFNNLDRTVVLNPELDSHFAIERTAGVVVTNNTVGFETLYYKKPLFTFGNSFYSDVPASICISDLGAAPEILSEHLSEEITDSKIISSIYSLRQASYKGERASVQDENVKSVIDSVKRFINNEYKCDN